MELGSAGSRGRGGDDRASVSRAAATQTPHKPHWVWRLLPKPRVSPISISEQAFMPVALATHGPCPPQL